MGACLSTGVPRGTSAAAAPLASVPLGATAASPGEQQNAAQKDWLRTTWCMTEDAATAAAAAAAAAAAEAGVTALPLSPFQRWRLAEAQQTEAAKVRGAARGLHR